MTAASAHRHTAHRARLGKVARASCAVIALMLIAPTQARGQRVSVLAHSVADGPATAHDLAAALSAAATRDGAIAVSQPFARAKKRIDQHAIVAARLDGFRRARQLAREGWRAYLAVEAEFAAARLAEARRVAQAVADLPGGLDLYSDVSLQLGVVLLHLHRHREATVLLRLARRLRPTRLVTTARYSPAVVKAYDDAVVGVGTVEVNVRATVHGARIEVDGRYVGVSPARTRLALGQHVVVARAPGFAATATAVAVSATNRSIRVQLERDATTAAVRKGRASLAVGTTEQASQRAVEGLLTYTELDGVLLVASVWRRGAPALLGQLCRSVPAQCGAVAEIGYPDTGALGKAARELWSHVTRTGARYRFPPTLLSDARLTQGESGPGTGTSGGAVRRRWWSSPWLWAGVGVAALAVGATVLLRGDTETRPLITVDPCEFGGCP